MTPPPYPYFPPPQYPPAPAVRAPRARRGPIDIIVTILMSIVAAMAALGSLWYSLLFTMATDSCGTQCNDAVLGLAYLVTWGGIAIAVTGGTAGIIISARRGRVMWIWPTLALGLVVLALVGGAWLSSIVMHHR
ncbi:hypothetical protein [Mycobacterium shimoidei]|uniref:hypothetical protein n=1 Tax=Mycobacterium shimoidei TaxID=29313 RepID=UPI00086D0E9D|nr:hypothetical protein [Mycobacterium shimoidei]MCV7258379.1 hypothetical protein [Mycobacterium shimoidei]ODR06193.1 hypothetical protein BHQ16_21895 [Mycobacterium shimoidei]ORW77950.1 hypothetical protein AWC26_18620 [Mycobacterium shimoidei]